MLKHWYALADEADRVGGGCGGGVQNGGAVIISGGSVKFKGGNIALFSAVRVLFLTVARVALS
jgi:hypothetical protein